MIVLIPGIEEGASEKGREGWTYASTMCMSPPSYGMSAWIILTLLPKPEEIFNREGGLVFGEGAGRVE